jgi:hypothetical protein
MNSYNYKMEFKKRISSIMAPLTLVVLIAQWSCSNKSQADDPDVWKKVHLNFKDIDNDGLTGPKNGKVSVSYEFCIPKEERVWKKVKKIDATAEKSGSKGRIGCSDAQWLVIGNTHQERYKKVLYDLASLPQVERIEQAFFE